MGVLIAVLTFLVVVVVFLGIWIFASAEGDQWSDPKGEFLSARLAGEVYRLYHEKGVGVDSMPPLSHPVGDFVRYHIRPGKHDITLYDWQQYMDFADRQFKRKPS